MYIIVVFTGSRTTYFFSALVLSEWMNDCCLKRQTDNAHLYHGENKLLFDKTMPTLALY